MTNPIFDRRTVLGGTAAAGLLSFVPPAVAATSSEIIATRSRLLPLLRKARYAADNRLVVWWARVPTFGNINARLTPLFTHEVASLYTTKDRDDGGFEAISLEIVFTTATDTGEHIEEIYNPYTEEIVPAVKGAIGPTTIIYTPDETILPAALPSVRLDNEARLGPALVANGQFWLRDDVTTTVSYDEPGKADFFVNDMAIYHGLMAEIEDPDVPMPHATISFESVTSWPAYLNMGDRPGSRLGRGHGQKVASVGEIPERIRTLLERFHPDIMANPLAALSKAPDPLFQ